MPTSVRTAMCALTISRPSNSAAGEFHQPSLPHTGRRITNPLQDLVPHLAQMMIRGERRNSRLNCNVERPGTIVCSHPSINAHASFKNHTQKKFKKTGSELYGQPWLRDLAAPKSRFTGRCLLGAQFYQSGRGSIINCWLFSVAKPLRTRVKFWRPARSELKPEFSLDLGAFNGSHIDWKCWT